MTSPGERVVTGSQMRSAREWLSARVDLLADWTCPERTLVALGALVAGVGSIDTTDLLAAAADTDTVDVALGLLVDVGLGCA